MESNATAAVEVSRGSKKHISFCCNDYFGLSQNLSVKKAAIAAIEKYGVGARASRYVTGNNSLYRKLEKAVAKFKKCSDAIIFSSGYASAIGAIPALAGEGDLILADRLIHASLIDGSKLSGARLMRFQHNDLNHAEEILTQNRSKFKKCLIITETVFSMDGDLGEVEKLQALAGKFDCLLLSDDAHGVTFTNNFSEQSHLQFGTFSKAFGSLGGYIAGEKILIDYLRNFARSAIYSTALPPAILAASLASLKIIQQKKLGEKVLKNAEYFCDLMGMKKPQSAIVVIILCQSYLKPELLSSGVGDSPQCGAPSMRRKNKKIHQSLKDFGVEGSKKALEVAAKVAEEGFLISAIRPPTVEAGKARLRITFSANHTKNQIKKLAEILLDTVS